MFYNCISLFSLPDISKWNTKNIQKIDFMFSNCSSLISLPDLSKWDTKNLKDMKYLLSDCISLSFYPNLNNWNNFNINNINETADYKKVEKINNFNFEYTTFKDPNEESYDKIFNDSEFIGKLKIEKFKRIYE